MATKLIELHESELPTERDDAIPGVVTTRATIGWAFAKHQAGSNLTNLDVLGMDGVKSATITTKARLYLGCHGVTALKPVTVKGVKCLGVALAVKPAAVLRLQAVK